MDLESVANKIGKAGQAAGVQAQGSEARSISAKRQMIDEYRNSLKPQADSAPKVDNTPQKVDKVNRGSYGSQGGERRIDTSKMTKPLGSFKEGGTVPETGPYQVHEGEAVQPAKNVSLYRAMHHLNKGGLHRALGVAEGDPIPEEKMQRALNSKNAHIKHMANFAKTMGKFKK